MLPTGNENSRFTINVYFSSNFSNNDIICDSGAILHLFYEAVSLSITQEKNSNIIHI